MVLINKYKYTKYAERGKYHCDISKFLDEQAGIKKEDCPVKDFKKMACIAPITTLDLTRNIHNLY